jgi:hypothetical protein
VDFIGAAAVDADRADLVVKTRVFTGLVIVKTLIQDWLANLLSRQQKQLGPSAKQGRRISGRAQFESGSIQQFPQSCASACIAASQSI